MASSEHVRSPSSPSSSPPMSPNSMVEAAFRAGVEDRKKRDADQMMLTSTAHRKNDNESRADAEANTGSNADGDDGVEARDRDEDRDSELMESLPPYDLNGKNKRARLQPSNNEGHNGSVMSDETKTQQHGSLPSSTAHNGLENQLAIIWNQVAATAANANDHPNYVDTDNVSSDDEADSDTDRTTKEMANHALDRTKNLVFAQLDAIIKLGLEAFQQNDELKRDYIQMKELSESRKREVQRLRASEDDLRASLSNMLKAVEASKTSARDVSRTAQTEARLRGEVSNLRCERDTAIGECAESNRRKSLLQEEVRLLKVRVGRLTQEKIKVERDSRAALSLARSMDSHAANDVDYYKRKVSDLNDHLQSKTAEISELKHQVNEYRRQMERSISHNRLANIRSDSTNRRR